MHRHFSVCAASILLLAGCSERNAAYAPPPPAPPPPPAMAFAAEAQSFSYSHTLWLSIPKGTIEPRFERARDACLQNAELHCNLISASINRNDNAYSTYANAALLVSLPHDQIGAFETILRSPLNAESPDAVTVTSRSTQQQNVTRDAADTDSKIAELTNYRDRLAALQDRPGLNVAELIQAAAELSKTQSQLDQLQRHSRDTRERIAREQLSVNLAERVGASIFEPVNRALANVRENFVRSLADAVEFLVGVVPWLPIYGAGLYVLAWSVRRMRRSRVKA
jgi:uncharacterized protein DUF4349